MKEVYSTNRACLSAHAKSGNQLSGLVFGRECHGMATLFPHHLSDLTMPAAKTHGTHRGPEFWLTKLVKVMVRGSGLRDGLQVYSANVS